MNESPSPQSTWTPDFVELSPLYLPLFPAWQAVLKAARARGETTEGGHLAAFPSLECLADAFARGPHGVPLSGCGVPLRPVKQPGARSRRRSGASAQRGGPGALDGNYTARAFLKGEVLTRPAHWHDLFNALCHLAFPLTKAVLNARQFWALDECEGAFPWRAVLEQRRTREQDYLTHFDEGGVVVATCDPSLLGHLRARRWKSVFWEARAQLPQSLELFAFGHALHETFLAGHRSQHALGMAVEVEPTFFARPLEERLHIVDTLAAIELSNRAATSSTAAGFPVPVLGYPGWIPQNAREEYYDDVRYFRP